MKALEIHLNVKKPEFLEKKEKLWIPQLKSTDPRIKTLLPMRIGCRIQRHHPKSGKDQYQCWYPVSAGDPEGTKHSRTCTGHDALVKVAKWAHERHRCFEEQTADE